LTQGGTETDVRFRMRAGAAASPARKSDAKRVWRPLCGYHSGHEFPWLIVLCSSCCQDRAVLLLQGPLMNHIPNKQLIGDCIRWLWEDIPIGLVAKPILDDSEGAI